MRISWLSPRVPMRFSRTGSEIAEPFGLVGWSDLALPVVLCHLGLPECCVLLDPVLAYKLCFGFTENNSE